MREYADLRTANIDRGAAWCPDQQPDLSFRACELAGEVGEVCELLLDVNMIGKGGEAEVSGWILALGDECADCVISLDLMGICVGLAPLSIERAPVSVRDHLAAGLLGFNVGKLCNIAKKIERERHGWRGSRATIDELLAAMNNVATVITMVAAQCEIDLPAAVARKFNATSEKVDLPHRMVVAK